jgi:hypothetical protein
MSRRKVRNGMADGFSARLARETSRALSRFRNTGPTSLARTLWRAAGLHFRCPPQPPAPVREERVVVTLTTIPARAPSLAPVLRSLIDQSEPADRIVLALPYETRRHQAYPKPETLDLPAGIDVIRCEDQGPATKLLPVLKLEPGAVMVVVDDDVIYPRRFIETLLFEHRCKRAASIGCRGIRLQEGVLFPALDHVFATGVAEATPVDVLFGTWGYLVPPNTLGAAVHDFSSSPDEVSWVDDVWISGHLARAGVPRFVVRANELPLETLASFRAALTAGVNKSGENDEIALKVFAGDW